VVTETIRYARPFRAELRYVNGIPTTTPHRWATGTDTWKEAGDLRTGDSVLDAMLRPIAVTIATATSLEPVYNLHVKGAHNFFVTDGGAFNYLVHNGGK